MLPKEKQLLKYSIILLILLSCTGTALAATYTVGTGDTDNFATIGAAISSASSGDTIIVRDGVYSETGLNVDKALNIRSENGSDNTIMKSIGSTVFNINSNDVTITGFNITGASNSESAGIKISSGSGCNVSDNILIGNYCGLYLLGSANNIFKNNEINAENNGIILNSLSNNNIFENNSINGYMYGIYTYDSINNTFVNNNVSGTVYGSIYLEESNNNTLENNSVDVNSYGVYLKLSSNTTLKNNTISGNSSGIGINLASSDYNTLTANVVSNSRFGIYLSSSGHNILSWNNMSLNTYNFEVRGESLEDYIHDINETNLVDGKPFYYWVDRCDESVPSDAGIVCIINSTNITVENVNVSSVYSGVLLAYSDNSTINNVTASGCDFGVYIHHSGNNSLTNSILENNYDNGIYLEDSGNNSLRNNILENNSNNGIFLLRSGNNTLRNNTVSRSNDGIYLSESYNVELESNDASWNHWFGIHIYRSNNNTLTDNVASNIDGNRLLADSIAPMEGFISIPCGIFVERSVNATLVGNTANNNSVSYVLERFSIISNSVSPNNNPEPERVYSCGFVLLECINTTFTENTAIGNAGNDFYSRYSNGTVDELALSNTPTLSFENDASILGIYLNETNPNTLSGKVNVNGYVTITGTISAPTTDISPETMVFNFLYDDSGMSSSDESSIGLYILNGTSWESVPNSSLNVTANYVSANMSEFGTFALFKDSESSRGGSNPTGGNFNIRYPSQGMTVHDEESPATTTTTPLATNNNGEVTGDTIAKSSDSAAAVTLHKGTVGTDSSGNPVTAITISTPASLPQGSPANGLYYDYGPSGTRFSQDVTITITFDPNDYDVNNPPEIYTYDEGTGEWVALDTTIDWEHGIATAYTNHFSLYALFGDDVVEEQASTDISKPVGEDVPVDKSGSSGYLYWIIGIVILAAIAVVFVKMQKR